LTSGAFDFVAERYDEWYVSHPGILRSELRAIASPDLVGEGLEIGVGTGVFSSTLGIQTGIDPSEPMLAIARERGIGTVCGIAESLPFADRSFDFVLITTTLCFLESPGEALTEARRVLKDRGSIAVCIIPRDSPWGRMYLEKGRAGHLIYRHARFFEVPEVLALLRERGFEMKAACSTLHSDPSAAEAEEAPLPGDLKGGFVCIKALKKG